ncbi:putative phenylalanine ammonia-lyase [Bisporella sp. PMI_857]|nr:putative phenylalanine ammonia-lyase [Bisporella sp. PMI_857]
MQLSAILPVFNYHGVPSQARSRVIIPVEHQLATLSMPEPWVRGAMLIRCNSLLRGHSAVRLNVTRILISLLQHDVIPLVPIRGSISASGDLCPLSYLAGTLEGNPDVRCWTGPPTARKLIPADEALQQLNIKPVVFRPKEALGLLNGTAVSAAVATLAQHQADHLIMLAQVATAMGVEAIQGRIGSFAPFIANIRPHSGQIEVAGNIKAFLSGTSLATRDEDEKVWDGHLRQDRYSLRTVSQWLGPYIEDLTLARKQLGIELNSTTDNPLIDIHGEKVHHGGNFQAVTATSSTEKARLAIQMIGKMVFAQSSELLNVHQNNGLPPNLAADEPSLSFTMKGVDINMAAYMSELAFLANPVSSHVQSAEMDNQSLNSLALISARYTHMSLDVLSLMLSAHLYSLCQALDLRAMNSQFIKLLKSGIKSQTKKAFKQIILSTELGAWHQAIWKATEHALESTITRDSSDRFIEVAKLLQPVLLEKLEFSGNTCSDSMLKLVFTWTSKVAESARNLFIENRLRYMENPDATPYLGAASKRIYQFIRNDLKVPFHQGLVDHPTFNHNGEDRSKLKIIGSQISIIHEALQDERLVQPVMECFKDVANEPERLACKAKL